MDAEERLFIYWILACASMTIEVETVLPTWVNQYIGIPFADKGSTYEKCSCYGLLRLVFREQCGIELPDYEDAYDSIRNSQAIAAAYDQHIDDRWRRVAQPEVLDAVHLRMKGLPLHVGVVVAPHTMLHIYEGVNSCVEKFNSAAWQKRVLGFYRYGNGDSCTGNRS